MLENKKWKYLFILILLILGVSLRTIYLKTEDLSGDEAAYTVRSQGWIDSLASGAQTTPYDWFSILPWWTKLSFHDHPPLVFAVQKVFMMFVDDSLYGGRMASVFASILAGFFIYGVTARLSTRQAGLWAVLLWTVNCASVRFGRIAIMESITICVILASMYVAYIAAENQKRLWWLGCMIGLGIVTKYTTILFIPVYAFIFFARKKEPFDYKQTVLALLAMVLVCMPVIIYNVELYRAVGHFDVQIATLLNQSTPEWTTLGGRSAMGSLYDRLTGMRVLASILSPIFLFFSILSIVLVLLLSFEKKKIPARFCVVGVGLLCGYMLILSIGTATRFIFYFVPYFCILIAMSFEQWKYIMSTKKTAVMFVIIIFLELVYTVNTIFGIYGGGPFGRSGVAYAPSLAVEDHGILALDQFIDKILYKEKSAFHINTPSKSLNEAIHAYAKNNPRVGVEKPILLVSSEEIKNSTQLQIMTRRIFYEGWSVISIASLPTAAALLEKIPGAEILYIYALPKQFQMRDNLEQNSEGDLFKNRLLANNIGYETIQTKQGDDAFLVFRFPATRMPKNWMEKQENLAGVASSTPAL